MGRQWKGTKTVVDAPGKLIHSGEYVCTEQKFNSEQEPATIWTYQFPKMKAANETWLYTTCVWNSLEAYSYAPAPTIHATNQTGATRYYGSHYFWGMNGGSEREFNLHYASNWIHSETLQGQGANIAASDIGAGNVPIRVHWDAHNNDTNRPGHTHAPNRNSGSGNGGNGSNDTRGDTIWYAYIRVWEIAY